MDYIINRLIISIFLFVTVGCSSNLSRSEAEEIILKENNYPVQRTHKLLVANQYDLETYHKLQEKGMLVYATYGSYMNRSVKVEFTEKGKQYVLSEPYIDITARVVDVVVGVESFEEITGIQQVNETSAIAEYTVSFKDITPFGEVLDMKPETFTMKATFNKYDDGWRIEKLTRKSTR